MSDNFKLPLNLRYHLTEENRERSYIIQQTWMNPKNSCNQHKALIGKYKALLMPVVGVIPNQVDSTFRIF